MAIGAYALALAGRVDEARICAASIRKVLPNYKIDDFSRAFRFDEAGSALFRKGAKLIGMD
jgi:hypothetical protein